MGLESQSIVLGVNLQETHKDFQTTHYSADVIIIDKRHESLRPLVYRLKDTNIVNELELKSNVQPYLNIVDDLFFMLGEIEMIDKKKKEIILSNQVTVSYKYLITAASSPTPNFNANEEFLIGLYALVESLKIQKNFPSDLLHTLSTRANVLLQKRSLSYVHLSLEDSRIMSRLLATHIKARLDNNLHDLKEVTQRLYEVQL